VNRDKIKGFVKETLTTILLIIVVSSVISYIRAPSLPSDKLPRIDVRLIDGHRFTPSKGQPVVLHFWGTWCSVCKMEASNIDFLSKHFNVLTIAVNSGKKQDVKAFMAQHHLTYPVLNDPNGRWAAGFKISAFPTTFIYDGNGRLRFTEVGYTTTFGLFARLWLTRLIW
jgi:thiol-disulfide isomerase/thioredoxin